MPFPFLIIHRYWRLRGPTSFHPSSALTPLRSLRGLLALDFRHCEAILLSPNDVAEMGKAWPNMHTLALTGDASSAEGVGTPLSLLTDFALSFPVLENLALHFSYAEGLPTADAVWTHFKKLRILSVGGSRVPQRKVREVKEFILGVCPMGVQLACSTAAEKVFDRTSWPENPDWATLLEVEELMDFASRMRDRWDNLSRSEGSDLRS